MSVFGNILKSRLFPAAKKFARLFVRPTSRDSFDAGRVSVSFKLLYGSGFLSIFVLLSPPCEGAKPLQDEIKAEFTRVGDAAHLEFFGRTQWSIKVHREGNNLIFNTPLLSPSAIAALKGTDVPWVTGVAVAPGPEAGHTVTIHLSGSEVDSFDYLTDQPSKFIIDIFKRDPKKEKEKESVAQPLAPGPETTAAAPAPATVLPAKKKKSSSRKPASSELIQTAVKDEKGPVAVFQPDPKKGIFDGGDPEYTRFLMRKDEINENAIIASRQNIYLPFPMLESDNRLIEELWRNPPIYEIAEESGEENKQARLLLTLFNNGRFNIFQKTLKDFFEKDYPKSRYNEIVQYMEADVYYDGWRKTGSPTDFDNAMTRYRSLVEQYPDSPLAERTALLVGFSFFERGDYFNALKGFQRFIQKYPKSKYIHNVRLAMGKNYLMIKNHGEAFATLDTEENDPTAGEYSVEAAVRKGDVNFAKKDYSAAVEAYRRAIAKYPVAAEKYPGIFYNTAEAKFWLGQYEESLNKYIEFLQKFPKSPHGAYAMTRIGELLEMLGADQQKINGAFLESLFRYQGSDGSGVAKIRLSSRRMPDMKEREIVEANKDIEAFVTKSKLPRLDEFRTLLQAEGYFRRTEYEKAIGLLIAYYQEHPTQDLSIFKERIINNIAKLFNRETATGKFFDAFNVYAKYATTWLKSSDRVDIDYDLARNYESAGVPEEAEKYYRKAINRIYAVQGTPKEKEMRVHQAVPTEDVLNLRIAAMALSQKKWSVVDRHLSAVRNPDGLNHEQQIERAEIATELALEKKDLERARGYLQDLVAHWRGKPAHTSGPYLSLAKIAFEKQEWDNAVVNAEKVLSMAADTNEVSGETVAGAMELKANTLLRQKKHDGAIDVFQEMLDRFESQRSMDSIRYRLGALHFEKGDLTSAEKVWSGLKEGSLWTKLSQERIQNAKWQDQYKKYIRRSPASETGDGK